MKIDFTGRGVEISDRIRQFTESKMDRLKKILGDLQEVKTVLTVEKYRHRAEINFHADKHDFHGAEETHDLFQSIDGVIEKLEKQARRLKDKRMAKKRHTTETIRNNGFQLEEVPPPPVERENMIQVIPVDPAQIRHMVLEEAVDALTKFENDFLVFRNADTEVINVVYRRKDGNIGHVGPTS